MKSNKNLVSIIIVNWNGKKWLKNCLESLLVQTYKEFEIILVDNLSTDDSIEFVEHNFPKIKVIKNKQNLGLSMGNNIGIKKAIGKYVLFMNNDTWVEKDFLEKLILFYKKNDYDVVAPREAKYDGEKQALYVTTIDPLGHYVYLSGDKYIGKKSFYLTGVCLLFSRQLYLETNGFDNNFFMYCEEVDWFWRLNLLGKKYSYADDIFVYHEGAGSIGKGIKYETFLWRNQNTLQMLLKNYKLPNLLLILPLYFLQNLIEILFFIIILKPNISFSYINGWLFVLRNMSIIEKRRRIIQKNRIIDDKDILKRMYFGSGKLLHFKIYFFGK